MRLMPMHPDHLKSGPWYLLLSQHGDKWYWVRWLRTDDEGCRFEEYERTEPDMTVTSRNAERTARRFCIQPGDVWGRLFFMDKEKERERKREFEPPPTTPPMSTGGGGGGEAWDTVR